MLLATSDRDLFCRRWQRGRVWPWVGLALLLAGCSAAPTPTPGPPRSTSSPAPATTSGTEVAPTPTAEQTPTTDAPEPQAAATPEPPETTEGHLGEYAKWSKVEIVLHGPRSEGMSDEANPFKTLLDVTFTSPGGEEMIVPGFYNGDGRGGLDGDVWQVRFAPDAAGRWSFETHSDEPLLNGRTGTFDVVDAGNCDEMPPGGLPDFACVGRLEYTGEYYLKFAEGPYWLKGGADEPEDFLAAEQTVGFESKEAAIDYLAGLGVNSLYMLLNNIAGDARNVWPWVGATEAEARANTEHFDIAKLERWEEVFTHLQDRGLVLHIVFDDDSAWVGYNRDMFYREMVARFAHHNGLIWNVSEEYNENYTPQDILDYAQMLDALDAYGHPVTVHHGETPAYWRYFAGVDEIDLTSLQTGDPPAVVNATAVEWRATVSESGKVIPISIDEAAEVTTGMRDFSRQIVWAAYMGGANFEMFTDDLVSYEDFAEHLADMTRARAFVESLPFAAMEPRNDALRGVQGYVFAKPDEVYAVYVLQQAPFTLDLGAASGPFEVTWLDPATGDLQPGGAVEAGDGLAFEPPFEGDNVLHLGREAYAAQD